MKQISNKSGFTIIEILLVIFIIGLLSAIGLNVYNEQQKASRDATRKSDLYLIATGLDNYFSVNKKYPMYDGSFEYGSASITPDHINYIQPGSDPNDLGKQCHYFSDGALYSRGTGNDNSCDHMSPNQSVKSWIPGLVGTYITKLPTDPKQKNTTSTSYADMVKAKGSTYQWLGPNYLYFYSKIANKISPSNKKLAEIPEKYYLIGALLENLDDKDSVYNSKAMFAGYNMSATITPSITDFNKNTFAISSEQ